MNNITVILKQDVKGLGKKGDLVKVSWGYARNYLIRENLAEALTESSEKAYVKEKKIQTKKLEKREEAADNIRKELENNYVMLLYEKAGKEGRLFGAVTQEIIAEKLKKDKGIEVDKRKILIDTPIKSVGTHIVQVKLFKGITAKFKVSVKEAKNE